MKAKLIFELPEDQHGWYMAVNASGMHCVLNEFDQWLRSKIKYEDLNDDQHQVFQSCRDQLRTLLYEENIDLDK
jgi:hypothetical protein